jgi:hypothetical protein
VVGSAGAGFLDPLAAVIIAGIAAREGVELWRGEDSCCTPLPGPGGVDAGCGDEDCDCC